MPKKQAAGNQTESGDKTLYIVTPTGERPLEAVVKDLKAKGFQVDQVMEAIGSITGFADPKDKKHLESIAGVQDVSEDSTHSIGPPGAPIS